MRASFFSIVCSKKNRLQRYIDNDDDDDDKQQRLQQDNEENEENYLEERCRSVLHVRRHF